MSVDTVRLFFFGTHFARGGPLAYNPRHYDLQHQELDDPRRFDTALPGFG
jgi:hypothetical protein